MKRQYVKSKKVVAISESKVDIFHPNKHYNIMLNVFQDGQVTINAGGRYLLKYFSAKDFTQSWDIIGRRVLMEKTGYCL